jgi:hypothetical protein
VSVELPSYVSSELQSGETLLAYVPAPDLTARRRIIRAPFPLYTGLVILVVAAFSDRMDLFAGAAGLVLAIALFIYSLRLCRTSYVISARRVIRFVGGLKIEDVKLAESGKPVLLDYAASGFSIGRWIARFLSLGPIVEVRRLKPEPWTIAAFVTSRDLSRMRIGYPGHSLPIAKMFDDVTRAWEATQDAPEAIR